MKDSQCSLQLQVMTADRNTALDLGKYEAAQHAQHAPTPPGTRKPLHTAEEEFVQDAAAQVRRKVTECWYKFAYDAAKCNCEP